MKPTLYARLMVWIDAFMADPDPYAECERLAKGERGWSQIPLVTKPWWLLALREAQGK